MPNPASPSSSPSKEASKGGEDELWEEAFDKMDEQEALFSKLPTTEEEAMKVIKKCNDRSHIGPIVLVKQVSREAFSDWLRGNEIGLHKSEIRASGTVYITQACAPDHGILRQFLGKAYYFPILYEGNASYLKTGSGAHGDQNPDVFWFRSGERSKDSRVLLEVGVSQSLPALRRRAYALCSPTEGHNWANLNYVVLIKRYEVAHLYIEIWRRIAPSQDDTEPSELRFLNDQRPPGELGMSETMEFVANAHACNTGVAGTQAVRWQFDLPTTCHIPAGDHLLDGGAAVEFDAQKFLDQCEYDDP